MGKNSFIVFYDYQEALADLTDEQVGQLFRALFNYEINKTEPDFSGELKIAFRFIKKDLDANLTKYKNVCERNRENGMKGGRPRKTENPENPKNPVGFLETQKTQVVFEKPKKPDNDSMLYSDSSNNINNINNINTNNREKIKENSAIRTIKENQKETAHKYGEYLHVLLTQKQYDKLIDDYGKDLTLTAVKYLDEYIEMKGVTYKNYNLALRKWVFDAVAEKRKKNGQSFMTHTYTTQELNNLFDNINEIV